MALTAAISRIYADDFAGREIPDDILSREELIDGEIVPMPPPFYAHDRVKNQISRLVDRYLATTNVGTVEIEMAFQIDEFNVLVPDVAYIRNERLYSTPERYFEGAPDIAFEVISPERSSHFELKLAAFFRAGCSAVCSVILERRSLVLHTRDGVREISGDSLLEFPALLPGFSAPVSAIFSVV